MAETNIEIKLKDVRLSFAQYLFETRVQMNDKGVEEFSHDCVFLLDKESQADQIKVIQDAMVAVRDAKWPGGAVKIPPERRCLRDGEPVDADTGQKEALYEGYAGQMFLSAKRKKKTKDTPNPVQLIGPRKGADGKFLRVKESDGLIYSGCYVNAIVRIYAYDGAGNNPNRINCSLEAVQFKRRGDPFGAKRVDADSAFDEEEGEDDMAPAAAGGDDNDPLG